MNTDWQVIKNISRLHVSYGIFVGEGKWYMIYIFWNSVTLNFVWLSRYYFAGKYYTFEKLLAFLVKLLCLLGFVEPTGPNSSLANISLLVEIWLCSNFYHSQEKGDYLVRIITSFRKLPKSFQKPRYIFIFLLPNYCIEKPPSFTNILSRN